MRKKYQKKELVNAFKNTPEAKGYVGKPRKKWLDDTENDLKTVGFRDWRKETPGS